MRRCDIGAVRKTTDAGAGGATDAEGPPDSEEWAALL